MHCVRRECVDCMLRFANIEAIVHAANTRFHYESDTAKSCKRRPDDSTGPCVSQLCNCHLIVVSVRKRDYLFYRCRQKFLLLSGGGAKSCDSEKWPLGSLENSPFKTRLRGA